METVRTFFVPPKRKHVLDEVLESFEDVHVRSLITLTRWMERLHGVQHFKELDNIIILALEKIQDFDTRDTSREAMAVLATITKGEFVVCMVMLSEFLHWASLFVVVFNDTIWIWASSLRSLGI